MSSIWFCVGETEISARHRNKFINHGCRMKKAWLINQLNCGKQMWRGFVYLLVISEWKSKQIVVNLFPPQLLSLVMKHLASSCSIWMAFVTSNYFSNRFRDVGSENYSLCTVPYITTRVIIKLNWTRTDIFTWNDVLYCCALWSKSNSSSPFNFYFHPTIFWAIFLPYDTLNSEVFPLPTGLDG